MTGRSPAPDADRTGVSSADVAIGVPAESTFVDADGTRLHVVLAGPPDGPPVVLLHGFPECWYGWHRQIRPLAEAGYRVVVPDQRGYNLSAKPDGVGAYRVDRLAADVVALVERFGESDVGGAGPGTDGWTGPRARLVGHDWGALVAWWVALHRPDAVERLCAVNVPHPTAFRRTLLRDPGQMLRSSYALFFQLPHLPEALASAGDWTLLARSMRRTSRSGTFDGADFERYRRAWSVPGAYSAMLNWYRAAARRPARPRRERVTPPTLVLWGTDDAFLKASMARDSVGFCDRGRLETLDATHWVQHERPERVSALLTEFLGE